MKPRAGAALNARNEAIVTQSWTLLLTSLLILAPPPGKAKDAAFDGEAILRRLAEMEPDAQQAWLRGVEARLNGANAVLLESADAAKKTAEYAAVLHQENVSFDALRVVLGDLDKREKAAVAKLVRQYRIQVYDSLRKEPKVYAEHLAAVRRVLAAWEAAGKPFEQQGKLVAWFAAALQSVAAKTAGPLPDDPTFEPGAAPTPVPDRKEPKTKDGTESPKESEKTDAKETPPKGAPKAEPASPEPAKTSIQRNPAAEQAGDFHPAGMADSDWPGPVLPGPLSAEGGTRAAPAEQQAADLPAVNVERRMSDSLSMAWRSMPAIVPLEEFMPEPAETAATAVGRRPDALLLPDLAPQSISSGPLVDSGAHWLPPLSALPRPSRMSGQPAGGIELLTIAPRSRHGRAALLSESASLPARVQDEPAGRPAVEVNVIDLAALIGGYNLSLRELEANLEEQHQWDAERLLPLLERLKSLLRQRDDLALIRELLPAEQQATLRQFTAPNPVISRLAGRIFEARTRAAGSGLSGTPAERRSELERLDALSRDLAKVAGERP